ncbi:MAG: L-glutamate gamma-semialdehyde dehydrogenase [Phycisphaerae bacterium]|nr:L-glutamate gamma-semialdehyde dehydrogenase [Phycisphaerae bacterium]
MQNTVSNIPKPLNETVYSYAPQTAPRTLLKQELHRLEQEQIEIPLIIGGKEVKTGHLGRCIQPHCHSSCLAVFHMASEKEVLMAIEASQKAKICWQTMPYQQRASIFLKAAELLSSKYRYTLNAATMLNQSKNAYQAEIDSACELVDFWRFNCYFMQELYKDQPLCSPQGTLNYVEYRPLEGFVFAVTPFNFTSIGGNLPTAPAMMGNTIVWKPASTAVYSNYFIMKILQEAGLPDGVINFIPGSGSQIGKTVLASPLLAGLHFTGSSEVFNEMWTFIGKHIRNYKTYPRIVGETGGKDFLVAHISADPETLIAAVIRGAYEYQGQKCSALSRMYLPKSLWRRVRDELVGQIKNIKVGPVQDFSNFMNAVIDKPAFDNAQRYIDHARCASDAEILCGGGSNDAEGYFIEPTLILTSNPQYKSMVEEIFAPILTAYIYEDEDYEKMLELCDQTSSYGLTGCVFAQDRYAICKAYETLRNAAGNFYINDKPTGAVVGQQPFGGSRGSGTNDKAGSPLNLLRWISVRAVKENFLPVRNYRYPFMEQE